MMRYGTDKPDLRNPLIIEDLSDFFNDIEFKAFKGQEVTRNCCKKNVR